MNSSIHRYTPWDNLHATSTTGYFWRGCAVAAGKMLCQLVDFYSLRLTGWPARLLQKSLSDYPSADCWWWFILDRIVHAFVSTQSSDAHSFALDFSHYRSSSLRHTRFHAPRRVAVHCSFIHNTSANAETAQGKILNYFLYTPYVR